MRRERSRPREKSKKKNAQTEKAEKREARTRDGLSAGYFIVI